MLKQAARKAHSWLPQALRLKIDTLSLSGMETLRKWRLPGHRITGQLARTDALRGSLVCFGDRTAYKAWESALFSTIDRTEEIASASLVDILGRNTGDSPDDLVLCPVTPLTEGLFVRRGWSLIPRHVICTIDLTKPIEKLISSRDAKNELRVVRKFNYQFRELRDSASFEEFYAEMLVPTVKHRHQNQGFLSSMEHLRRTFDQGYLLAAYLDSQWVAANLLMPGEDGVLVSANVGWRAGSDELMKSRVVSALIHEMIIRGQKQGFRVLDLGSSNPFAADGPLNFKLKWDADIELPQIEYEGGKLQGARSFVAARFDFSSPSAQAMLHNNPLFAKHHGALRVIGWSSPIPSTFRHQVEKGVAWIDLA